MRQSILLIILLSFGAFLQQIHAQSDTMKFSTSASHPGFTFTSWNWDASGTIFMANLIVPSIIEKDTGTFDLISFDVGPFVGPGGNSIRLTSDMGDTLVYTDGVATTHTVNWTGISSLTFERQAGSAAAADHDNFILGGVITEIGSSFDFEETFLINYPEGPYDKLRIKLPRAILGEIEVSILSMDGKLLKRSTILQETLDLEFPIQDIPNGNIYLYRLSNGEKVLHGTFIKDR